MNGQLRRYDFRASLYVAYTTLRCSAQSCLALASFITVVEQKEIYV